MSAWMAAAAMLAAVATSRAQDRGARVTDAPVAWRDGVVRLGDSEAQVLKRAGKRPERAVTLYLADHVAVGEQWRFSGAPGSRQLLWVARMRGRVVRMWIETSGGAALP